MRSFLKSSVLGAIDQALMSAFSLLMALAFIRWAPKEEYAIYTLLLTAVALAQTLQNALVNAPLITLYNSHVETTERHAIFSSAFALQCTLMVVLAFCGFCYLLVNSIAGRSGLSPSAILAASAASVGVISREYARGNYYLQNNALGALVSDVVYILTSAVAVGIWVIFEGISATGILASLGIAGLLSGLISSYRLGVRISFLSDISRKYLKDIWQCARWTLPSVMVTWAYANAYILIVQYFLGLTEVAELSAARLFLMPLSLMAVGWASVFRPKSTKLFMEGKFEKITALMRHSAGFLLSLSVIYGVVLMIVLPLLEKYLLGNKYSGIDMLVLCWFFYFAIGVVRAVGTSAMMASARSFKPLFYYSCVTAAATTVGVLISASAGQPHLVVVALTLGETALAAYVWLVGWPRCVVGAKQIRT